MNSKSPVESGWASSWDRMRRDRTERYLFRACSLMLAGTFAVALIAACGWLVLSANAQLVAGGKRTPPGGPPIADTGNLPASLQTREELRQWLDDEQAEIARRLDAEQKETEEQIDKDQERSKMLLDGLVTLVGVYSILLGITAFVTVKFTRDDAKEALKKIQVDAKDELARIRKELDEIERNFPEFSRMDKRFRMLVKDIELRMPSMDEWDDDDWMHKLKPADHVFIQNSETTILAISVFGLDRAPSLHAGLVIIYSNFARYHEKRGSSSENPAWDFERALFYASRVIDLSPESSAGYRQRGAIYLSRYLELSPSGHQEVAKECQDLLHFAERDLVIAIGKGTDGTVDAGAYYNQALLENYRGKFESAVSVSRRLLSLKSKVPIQDRERYMPSVYRNLGCYLAKLAYAARAKKNSADEARFSREAVEAIEIGVKDFGATKFWIVDWNR